MISPSLVVCSCAKGRNQVSPEAAAAVEFTRQLMLDMDLDSVYLQELMVKRWVRGDKEHARMLLEDPSLACGYQRDTQQELSQEAYEKDNQ